MIEDKELRDLFRIESGERLQLLDNGLLQLEKTPADQALLEDLFREAHSLKGAARMLGLSEIQTLAHRLEDALGAARQGGAVLQAEAIAEMNLTLEALRRSAQTAIGEAAQALSAGQNAGWTPDVQPRLDSSPASAGSQPAAPKAEAFRIETIHVDPRKLDALLTQAGELTVTKLRIARRLAELDELLDYCEEGERVLHAGPAGRPSAQRMESLRGMLSQLRSGAYEDSARLDFIADQLESGIRSMRLLPMSTLFGLFPRLVRDLAREQHKEAELLVEGEETVADKHVLEEIKDPLMHMLRNAIGHGIESPEQREQA
ncbi:MAG: Hpt domain-containing protein, partial [Sterolibacterium sp.]